MIRSSPQFGFTLVAYEYLHKVGQPMSYCCPAAEIGVRALIKLFPVLLLYLCDWLVSLKKRLRFPQYPVPEKTRDVATALTSGRSDDLSKIRARNALKILLDVHGDIGRRAAAAGRPLGMLSGGTRGSR